MIIISILYTMNIGNGMKNALLALQFNAIAWGGGIAWSLGFGIMVLIQNRATLAEGVYLSE